MKRAAYYNDNDPFCAEWLRNLIRAGLIVDGEVDERSIVDVKQDDLKGYTQCHFFAGVGGWSYALRFAGWPDDRPVWTGSCPCQPFSIAGKQRGSEDERHLWPAWFRLIRECRPPTVFGEQVAATAGLAWLDLVLSDLESVGYAAAAAVVPAGAVGAPHRRQRLWFVADAGQAGLGIERGVEILDGCGAVCSERMGNAERPRLEGHRPDQAESGRHGAAGSVAAAGVLNPWSDLIWLPCADGKARPIQPGLFPLAHGVSGRVGRLRSYGNAIVPQVAAEFVAAFMSTRQGADDMLKAREVRND